MATVVRDWYKTLKLAEKRVSRGEKPFTEDEIDDAGRWNKCAVGEQRVRGAEEVRVKLKRLFDAEDDAWCNPIIKAGEEFDVYVRAQNLVGAKNEYTKIAALSAAVALAAKLNIPTPTFGESE